MVWLALFYCCQREALWMAGRLSVGVLEYPMFGPIEEAKKASCCPSLKYSVFRPAIVLPQLFLGLELEACGYELSWT